MSFTSSTESHSSQKKNPWCISTFHKKTHNKVLEYLKIHNIAIDDLSIVDNDLAYSYITTSGSDEQKKEFEKQEFRILID